MSFLGNNLKWLIIPKHNENNIGNSVQDAPCTGRTTFGHMYFITYEFAGLFDRKIHFKVSIQLLRGIKYVKGSHFCDKYNGTEKSDSWQ